MRRHGQRWIAAAAVLVLVLVAGWWIARNAFVETVAVPGTRLVLKTQLGDDGHSLEVARRGAVAADRWLREAFGHPLQEETAIRLARTANCVWIDGFGDQSTAWSGGDGICVYTSRPLWRSMREREGGRDAVELIAHEVIHEAQRELGCVDEPDRQRFRWLMEGAAVYGAREALIATGERRAEETEASIREGGGFRRDLVALELFETRNGDDAAYQLWHRAVRLLADEHGGPRALRQFCAEVGQGRPWRSAFETSFGLTTVAFYDEFDRRRVRDGSSR